MTTYSPPLEHMRFILDPMIDRLASLPGYQELDRELVGQVLEEAGKFASGALAPLNAVGDRQGARLENGVVRTPEGFKDAYHQFVESGWNGLPFPEEWGGQGLPWTISTAVSEMWHSANTAFSLCPLLTQAGIELLLKFGTDQQKDTYLQKLVSGEWTGTMCLTEPQAGTDVGALKTKAVKEGDHYRISGTKIFITYGDHDYTDNVIHMVLARTSGAPAGTKGISLFIVPKFLVNEDGSPGDRNDLRPVSLEHKLGIHASPTCVMSFGDNEGAIGYLVGEEQGGMKAMFTMMNNARLAVGLQGLAIAETAFQTARLYAGERVQGMRRSNGAAVPAKIIEYPDIRRMLMSMRCRIEAMRAMIYEGAFALDRAVKLDAGPEQQAAQGRIDLLIPLIKAWCSDQGFEIASDALQIHGGMGYIEETGAAQHLRDARIAMIYEGTNGIQALDLVGRKLPAGNGAHVASLFEELQGDLDALSDGPVKEQLSSAFTALRDATAWITEDNIDTDDRLAGATPYLRMFATTLGGFLLARATTQADENGRIEREASALFYVRHVLPPATALLVAVKAGVAASTGQGDG
ncbi:MAG: acyl-CoA dehydrogenase [Alphaproteobacteria bacterium]|nr:acyl-CoA dehydrogenase [Alphaproteobacteria bacterium]